MQTAEQSSASINYSYRNETNKQYANIVIVSAVIHICEHKKQVYIQVYIQI